MKQISTAKGWELVNFWSSGAQERDVPAFPSNRLVRVNEDCMHSHHSFLNGTCMVHLTVG